jgi:hypothetical protein
MWREIFPAMLAQLEHTGALTITVTDTEVVVSSGQSPQTGMYRVQRKRKAGAVSDVPLACPGGRSGVAGGGVRSRYGWTARRVRGAL